MAKRNEALSQVKIQNIGKHFNAVHMVGSDGNRPKFQHFFAWSKFKLFRIHSAWNNRNVLTIYINIFRNVSHMGKKIFKNQINFSSEQGSS